MMAFCTEAGISLTTRCGLATARLHRNFRQLRRGNAVGVVKVLITQLKSNEADKEKAYDLGWLLHLVGDLHQPMHAVNGISETLPEGDRGGNLVEIKGATDGASELHAFWDEVLGKTAPAEKTPPHHPHLE